MCCNCIILLEIVRIIDNNKLFLNIERKTVLDIERKAVLYLENNNVLYIESWWKSWQTKMLNQ